MRFAVTAVLVAAALSGSVAPVDAAQFQVQFLDAFGGTGSGSGQFNSPAGITVDAAGNVWVVDRGNNRLQQFLAEGTFVSEVTGLSSPKGIATGPADQLYVANSSANQIAIFDALGVSQGTIGSLGSGNGQFVSPEGVAVDAAGNIYVADTSNQRLQIFDNTQSHRMTLAVPFPGFPSLSGTPSDIDLDAAGRIYVTDQTTNRVQVFDAVNVAAQTGGAWLFDFGGPGLGTGQFLMPEGLSVNASDNALLVADMFNDRLQLFSSLGSPVFDVLLDDSLLPGSLVPGNISSPEDAVFRNGLIYVVDTGNDRVLMFQASQVVPEPSSLSLWLAAMGAIHLARRRRRGESRI